MLLSRRISLALGVLFLSFAAFASAAHAAGPVSVVVRVEGTNQTLVPPTEVTTTAAPLVKDGNPEHSCPGTSALGALQLATDGNWSGPWEAKFKQYELFSIEGESHEFGSGAYWDVWINHKESQQGACEAEPETGQEVLLFPCSEAAACPSPLGIEPAKADVGEVAVTVKKYGANGEAVPVAGATVTGAATPTDASGHTTLTFSSPGTYTLHATAPESVRDETSICIHAGNDGTCGTQAPSGPASASTPAALGVAGVRYTGPNGIVAKAGGVIDGHVYGPGAAPRLLQGTVSGSAGLRDVKLRLTRTLRHGGRRARCSYYDGLSERFRVMKCGAVHGRYFSVGARASVSYLLPSALAAGRYVLDIEATDAAGNQTRLARGTSRIVFYVG